MTTSFLANVANDSIARLSIANRSTGSRWLADTMMVKQALGMANSTPSMSRIRSSLTGTTIAIRDSIWWSCSYPRRRTTNCAS
jgi:hypothetical protein